MLFEVEGDFILDTSVSIRNIVDEVIKALQNDVDVGDTLEPPTQYDCLLQHIETGYLYIYSDFTKLVGVSRERNYDRDYIYLELSFMLETLALELKHGKVLKGHCYLCPQVSTRNIEE